MSGRSTKKSDTFCSFLPLFRHLFTRLRQQKTGTPKCVPVFLFVPCTRNRTHSRKSRAVFFCYVTHSRHRRALVFLRESGSDNSLAVSRRNLAGEASTRTRHRSECLFFCFAPRTRNRTHSRKSRGGAFLLCDS